MAVGIFESRTVAAKAWLMPLVLDPRGSVIAITHAVGTFVPDLVEDATVRDGSRDRGRPVRNSWAHESTKWTRICIIDEIHSL